MGGREATAWMAVVAVGLGGALALALPRGPQRSAAGVGLPSAPVSAPPAAVLVVQTNLLDALPDERAGVTLLSREVQSEPPAAQKETAEYLLLQMDVAPAGGSTEPALQPTAENGAAAAPRERRMDADAAWLVGPGQALVWQQQSPDALTVVTLNGIAQQWPKLGRPTLVVPPAGIGAAPQFAPQSALLALAGRVEAGAEEGAPTGDRLLGLGRAVQDVVTLPRGAITAVAQGPGGDVAIAWVEPGRPPAAGITVLKPDGMPGWRGMLRAPAHRLALLDADRLVVAAGQELLGFKQGEIVWRRTLSAVPVGLGVDADGLVLVALPNHLLALANNGLTRWEVTPRRPIQALRLSAGGTRAALIESGQAEVLNLQR